MSVSRETTEGIRDAIEGNFYSVTVQGQKWMRMPGTQSAPWWVVGVAEPHGGFRVRQVFAGRAAARRDKLAGETVRQAVIFVKDE